VNLNRVFQLYCAKAEKLGFGAGDWNQGIKELPAGWFIGLKN
jgi:hypothetical protein